MRSLRTASSGSELGWPGPSPNWVQLLAIVNDAVALRFPFFAMAVKAVRPNGAVAAIPTRVAGSVPFAKVVTRATVLTPRLTVTLVEPPNPPPVTVRLPPGVTYGALTSRWGPTEVNATVKPTCGGWRSAWAAIELASAVRR